MLVRREDDRVVVVMEVGSNAQDTGYGNVLVHVHFGDRGPRRMAS